MSSRMSRDERDLENLSTTVRPMNITAELAQMQSSDWLDAKLWLDERRNVAEVKKFKLLMSIIKVRTYALNLQLILLPNNNIIFSLLLFW